MYVSFTLSIEWAGQTFWYSAPVMRNPHLFISNHLFCNFLSKVCLFTSVRYYWPGDSCKQSASVC